MSPADPRIHRDDASGAQPAAQGQEMPSWVPACALPCYFQSYSFSLLVPWEISGVSTPFPS